ncbi:unnamed protein product [Bursaphelenchus okinawaensis]|uniref:Aminotransferase class I/classII large domain-containing protein n=1 Tax=Bursaphelenchus okinawaensis TaxID=465554 RepID=A0A811LII4_9BILA|nr:unnamed protein product [Bursaphelenchus okinawaensis]CAG9123263.1 unnamed protein product [Bursaphelenchus okinawaensis]
MTAFPEYAFPSQHTLFDSSDGYTFNIGAPAQHFLKDAAILMKEATVKKLDEEINVHQGRLLQYGAACGARDYLEAVRNFLADQYQDDNVDVQNLVQTAGATTALIILLNQMFPQKTTVYFEQLSYFLAAKILKSVGFECKGVDTGSTGIDLEDLEKRLQEDTDMTTIEEKRKDRVYSSVIYVVPIYQNPIGVVLSAEKCQKLVALARKYNSLVFCDDVYNMLHYDGTVQKRLFAYDNKNDKDYGNGHVVSNGTFSKILAPGLRLGWMELPKAIKDKYFYKSDILVSSGSLNTYTGGIVAELLKDGKAKAQVEKIRNEQKLKMEILLNELDQHLPKDCSIIAKPDGGYFVQVLVPPRVNCVDFVAKIKESHKILLHDGRKFVPDDRTNYKHPEYANSIRLCIAFIETDKIAEGIRIFCSEVDNYGR